MEVKKVILTVNIDDKSRRNNRDINGVHPSNPSWWDGSTEDGLTVTDDNDIINDSDVISSSRVIKSLPGPACVTDLTGTVKDLKPLSSSILAEMRVYQVNSYSSCHQINV